jgi:EmrB/QacA subfamily drug resistance transporter
LKEDTRELTSFHGTDATGASEEVRPSPAPAQRIGLRGRFRRLPYKWVALSVTTLGLLMAAIDGTIVTLAIPQMMTKLNSDLVTMIWVIMGYLLVTTVFLMTFGRIADMLGRVRMYNLGFVVFTLGSLLCGFSQSGTQLILARLVQGGGGALLMVNSMAIITEAFPRAELGRALGLNAITFSVGAIVGPIIGGLILSFADWRWVFFINVPIGIFGTFWAYRQLHEIRRPTQRERFDPIGAVTFSLALLLTLGALTQGIELGWTSPVILGMFAAVIALVAFFVWWEKHITYPVLDFKIFSNRVYNFSVTAAMLQALAMTAVNFIIIFYLQAIRGYDPLTAALLLIPMPLASSIVGPLSGMLSDRIGARVPATVGLIVQVLGLAWLTTLGLTSPYWQVAIGLAVMGIGAGMFFAPNSSAAMGSSPPERLGIASATLATLRNCGMVVSFALVLAVTAGGMSQDTMMQVFLGSPVNLPPSVTEAFMNGMDHAFWVSAAICSVAAVISLARGRENRQQAVPVPIQE